jgi:hypothetical protein
MLGDERVRKTLRQMEVLFLGLVKRFLDQDKATGGVM